MTHMPFNQDDFKQLIENANTVYVDKSYFIKEWWESSYDKITLILRPRFFGKTLNMSMIDYFFSNQYENSHNLFENLIISNENNIIGHQGQYPVIFLSFNDLNMSNCESMKSQIKMKIWQIYLSYKKILMESANLDLNEKIYVDSISFKMTDEVAVHSIRNLCSFLFKVYGGKMAIVLFDDYDSILTKELNIQIQNDEWQLFKDFFVNFFVSTFNENDFLLRGLVTGVLNFSFITNLSGVKVYTMSAIKYSNCFGFINDEIIELSERFNCFSEIESIEKWYGGFSSGDVTIFNPFSIITIRQYT